MKLNITEETINKLAALNSEVRNASHQRQTDGQSGVDSLMEYVKDPNVQEINSILNALSIEEKRELAAIMWLGRENYASFKDAFDYAQTAVDEAGFATYISEKPLHKYLPAGVAKIKSEGVVLG